ncbi:MAG: molecular chaperone TorD family protein [Rhodocyclales bacterium]|nr:molecular chaperone TorD family protein [Rhodocyclales bacterium]
MINSGEMQIVASGRAKTYALLAALFSAPPAEELAAMIRKGGLAPEGSGPLREAVEALTKAFRLAASSGTPDADIIAEYTRLFSLPSGVVPHESYYADKNQRVGGHVTAAVKLYYDNAAAELTGACLELPDHMGVELEFMQFLCDIETQFWNGPDFDGLQRCLEFQNGFLSEHLLCWHRELCEKILNETGLEIYRALATLTLEFLEAERIFVPVLAQGIHSEWRTPCASES